MLKNKRGFTLMELLIVIAVLGVLVLLAAPKLLDYTEEAELVRIQHDVKVMEQEMATVLLGQELKSFKNNNKQLSSLIVQKKLFESEGVAEKIDVKHLSRNGVFNGNLASLDRSNLGVGGNLISVDSKLGSGGELYTVASKGLFADDASSFSIDKTYKIIPENYNDKIGTNLDGTFYANSLGKVYYEHDKSLTDDSAKKGLNCPVASELGYVFEIVNGKGTITGWNGTEVHLVIPPAFLMEVNGRMNVYL